MEVGWNTDFFDGYTPVPHLLVGWLKIHGGSPTTFPGGRAVWFSFRPCTCVQLPLPLSLLPTHHHQLPLPLLPNHHAPHPTPPHATRFPSCKSILMRVRRTEEVVWRRGEWCSSYSLRKGLADRFKTSGTPSSTVHASEPEASTVFARTRALRRLVLV